MSFWRQSKEPDDYYIEVIKFGVSKLNDGVTPKEVVEHLARVNSITGDNDFQIKEAVLRKYPNLERFGQYIFVGDFQLHHDFGSDYKLYLSHEAYFNYLEYIELKESRKNANSATRLAILAIVISFIATWNGIADEKGDKAERMDCMQQARTAVIQDDRPVIVADDMPLSSEMMAAVDVAYKICIRDKGIKE